MISNIGTLVGGYVGDRPIPKTGASLRAYSRHMGISVQVLDMSSTGHDAWTSYTMSARLGWTGIMSMSALLPPEEKAGVATSPHYPFNILDIGPVAVDYTTSEARVVQGLAGDDAETGLPCS